MGKLIDLSGQKFGRLLVINQSNINNFNGNNANVGWICLCECGNTIEVNSRHLRRGNTLSCGCYQKEQTVKANIRHGFCKEPLYAVWDSIKQRCLNVKNKYYSNYGGRGILIHDSWIQYVNFRDWALSAGYRKGLTIDRIDNNGNYEPNNCRWTTYRVQENNKRNNSLLTYNNKTMTISQWSEEIGIKQGTISARLYRGWSIEDSLNIPVKRRIIS